MKSAVVLFSSLALASCSNLTPQTRGKVPVEIGLADAIGNARFVVDQCEGRGYYPKGTSLELTKKVNKLGEVADLDYSRVRETYFDTKNQLPIQIYMTFPLTYYEIPCRNGRPMLSELHTEIDQYIQWGTIVRDANTRDTPRRSYGGGVPYKPTPAPSYPTYMPSMPSGEPSFGLPENRTVYGYGDNELTSCTGTSSGVYVCR